MKGASYGGLRSKMDLMAGAEAIGQKCFAVIYNRGQALDDDTGRGI